MVVVSVDEMVDAIQPDKSDHDEVDGNDEIQQSRHNQDQDARYEGLSDISQQFQKGSPKRSNRNAMPKMEMQITNAQAR